MCIEMNIIEKINPELKPEQISDDELIIIHPKHKVEFNFDLEDDEDIPRHTCPK